MAAAAFVLATAALALAAARIAPGDAESLMPQNPNAVSPAAQQQGLNVPSAIIKTNFPEGVNSPRDLAERMEQQARKDIDNGVAVNAKHREPASPYPQREVAERDRDLTNTGGCYPDGPRIPCPGAENTILQSVCLKHDCCFTPSADLRQMCYKMGRE